MKRRILGRAAAGLLAVATLAAPAFADTIGGAMVHTSNSGLNLRAEATTLSASLATVPNGAFLLVEEAVDGWYRVVYNGREGYVSSDYAEFAEDLDGSYTFGASTLGTDVNLRDGAGTGTGVVKHLPDAGSALTVTGVSGNWLKILDGAGAEGYIRSDLVNYKFVIAEAVEAAQDTPVVSDAPIVSTVGEQIAAAAREYIGYSYRWGGMSPETGFDCSGFANYIYKLYGYSMERVAQSIYTNNGAYVSYDALQPGDLLFFGYGPSSVTHVGIYVGGGQMVHASTSTTGVILTDLNGSSYYNRMYVGAKRIVS